MIIYIRETATAKQTTPCPTSTIAIACVVITIYFSL